MHGTNMKKNLHNVTNDPNFSFCYTHTKLEKMYNLCTAFMLNGICKYADKHMQYLLILWMTMIDMPLQPSI